MRLPKPETLASRSLNLMLRLFPMCWRTGKPERVVRATLSVDKEIFSNARERGKARKGGQRGILNKNTHSNGRECRKVVEGLQHRIVAYS